MSSRITVDETDFPAIAISPPGLAYPEAIQWVRDKDIPLLFPDPGPPYFQFQLAYRADSGSVPTEPFRVPDLQVAIERARTYLRGHVDRYAGGNSLG